PRLQPGVFGLALLNDSGACLSYRGRGAYLPLRRRSCQKKVQEFVLCSHTTLVGCIALVVSLLLTACATADTSTTVRTHSHEHVRHGPDPMAQPFSQLCGLDTLLLQAVSCTVRPTSLEDLS